MQSLSINMFSKAESKAGQGVGSAYRELVNTLVKHYPKDLKVTYNALKTSDISHYHTINFPFFLSTFLKRRRGVRLGYVHFLPETLRGSIHLPGWIQTLFDKYLIAFYRRMDHLVVVNPVFIDKLVQDYHFDPKKLSYIPNFVSTDTFYPESQEEKASFRQALGLSPSDFVVLGVGQIQGRKGIDDFIQLGVDHPEICFYWVGGFTFGKLSDDHDRYQEALKHLPANVHFTGVVDRADMVKYYNLADLFLLPSYSELFPMSILEAFACQTPVMLRDLDLYQDILGGYYIPCADRAAMGKKIVQLAQDPQSLKSYQDKAQAASHYYSEDRVAQIWLNFYRDLAKSQEKNSHHLAQPGK